MPRINRQALLETLTRVEPGRSTKNFLEQSSCFVFKDGFAITFNDEICCRTKTDLGDEIEGAVHGRHLKEVLDKMSDDEVDITIDGSQLLLKAKRKRVGIRLEKDIRLPVESVEAPQKWTPIENPEAFGRAVRQVCGTAGANQEEFMAVCVNMTPSYMESTDRYQATRYDIDTGVSERFLVRAKSLNHIHQLGVTKVGLTPNWVHYKNKALIVSIRRQADEYYDLSTFFDFKGAALELPRGADEAAKLGKVFAQDDKENTKVLVSLADGSMRVRGEGAYGFAETTQECNYRGSAVTFRISPDTLETLVKDHQRCEVTEKKLMVRGDKWSYISVLGSASPKQDTPSKAQEEPQDEGSDNGDGEEGF